MLQPPASGSLKEETKVQQDAKQAQELQAFQIYLHEHGLKEEEVDPFGNCLFLSLARQVVPMQEGMYPTTTPVDVKDVYKITALSICRQALEYMLAHRRTTSPSILLICLNHIRSVDPGRIYTFLHY